MWQAQGRVAGCSGTAYSDNLRVVATGLDESDEIGRADAGCRGIYQGVIIQHVMLHHGLVENDIDQALLVIDQAKWCY